MENVARLNSALWKDLERRLGTRDLVEWLEKETARVAALGRNEHGPLAFSSALLRDRSISLIRPKPYLPALQTISKTTQGGYEICYSPFQRIEDRRFGIAHEIAHTFWLAPEEGGQPLSPLQRGLGDDPTIEWLCNRGAAALLLPRSDVAEFVGQPLKTLHLIPSIAKHYLVPERLVARRIFHDLGGADTFLLSARLKGNKGPRQRGQVVWFAAPPGSREVRKRLEGRIVPLELLPEVPLGASVKTEVDGRWWVLVGGALKHGRAQPLRHSTPVPSRIAWVGRCADSWFFALPQAS